MNNMFLSEYKNKLTTPEEAVKVVKSGDWIDYGCNQGFPVLLDAALAERKEELYDVKIRGLLAGRQIKAVECDPEKEHFTYNCWHMDSYERKLCDRGLCYFTPMLFRYLPTYYRRYLTVNVAMLAVTPMDKHGNFNFSFNNSNARAVFDVADVIILEVNENLPRIPGLQNTININEVDMVVEGPHDPLLELQTSPASETDMKIANLLIPRIANGSTIQLGVGALPDTVGTLIAESDLKDLGIHSELVVNAHYEMAKAGKITNKYRKGLFRGKTVFGLGYGNKSLYDWLDGNEDCINAPMDFVNDPKVIADIDNFVSINSCVSVDLFGQVGSESAGTRHISGTGGQVDFLNGAFDSPTGASYIACTSTFTDRKGVMHSRFKSTFNGDIVTDPRSQVQYLVTEYGIENLAGTSTWERAEKIISLAHPDFREELISSAEELKIWRRSNKLK